MTMTMTISRSPPEGFPGSGCPPLTTARAVGLAAFGSRSRRLLGFLNPEGIGGFCSALKEDHEIRFDYWNLC